MNERIGVLAALLSSTLGGTVAVTTRFVIADVDPLTLGALRFGGAFLVLLPVVLALRQPWPKGRDWFVVALLGGVYFCVYQVLYNLAFVDTTAAHGSMIGSTLALMTMAVAGLFGVERLSLRKAAGVLVATGGVAAAPLTFLIGGMGVGSTCLLAIAAWRGGFGPVANFGPAQWIAVGYMALVATPVALWLWIFALNRATPTRIASTMAMHPVSALILAAIIIGEPVGLNLAVGVVAVLAGIWIAASEPHNASTEEATA
jgi:drug/metabolite transporter (DMT)-like permease